MANYWRCIFSPTTWDEFLAAGATTAGFSLARESVARRISPGDKLICYLTKHSRVVGVLEAVSGSFHDESRTIWSEGDYPIRVNVQLLVQLQVESGITLDQLDGVFQASTEKLSLSSFTGLIRANPTAVSNTYGSTIEHAVRSALENPVITPLKRRSARERPSIHESAAGYVTVPDDVNETSDSTQAETKTTSELVEGSLHTEIQWRLLKLGSDMGLDVWVARNDKGKSFEGHCFKEIPRIRSVLPTQFDDATHKTIELIDVLWLSRNSIVGAFEIESTTSIYSGLLRMSDLLAMQPNLNIPLYLVAPDDRRNKVLAEVNRPTFARLHLVDKCRYLSFSAVLEDFPSDMRIVRSLKPDFLEAFSESCALDE